MGGHGGLNILPQKRWNVYRRDNRLRVRRDEEQHREEQQQERLQDERQRMSNVLVLLRRKKVEAQARRQERHQAQAGEAKAEQKTFQGFATSDTLPSDSSHVAWLSSLVDFSGNCNSLSISGKDVRCESHKCGCCPASLSDQGREASIFETSPKISAGSLATPCTSGVRRAVLSGAAVSNNVLSNCPYHLPRTSCTRVSRAELDTASLESFSVDTSSVVRVRVPSKACSTAGKDTSESCRAAVVSASTTDSAAIFEKESSFEDHVTERLETETGEAKRAFSSAAVDTSLREEHQKRSEGELRHVNLFQAEEDEMRRLETRRKQYLLRAGYTPGAQSEFEAQIRKSSAQMPWYLQPPSSSGISQASAGSLLQTVVVPSCGFSRQSQHVLQRAAFTPGEIAQEKGSHPARTASTLVKHEGILKGHGCKSNLFEKGSFSGLHTTSLVCGFEIAGVENATSSQHVSVHADERSQKSVGRPPRERNGHAPSLENEVSRRRSGEPSGRGRSKDTSKRDSRMKAKRIRREKGGATADGGKEDEVECLRLTVLVQDEDESGVMELPMLC